jgi:hypothetical protein
MLLFLPHNSQFHILDLTEHPKLVGLEVLQRRRMICQQPRKKTITSKDRLSTYICGFVELEVQVHLSDAVHVRLIQVEGNAVEVLGHNLRTRGLGDDSQAALSGPSQEDLSRGLVVLGGHGLDSLMAHKRLSALGTVHVELDETSGAERRVGSDNNALSLSQADKVVLLQVRVQLDLESRRANLGVLESVIQDLGLVVGDTDALGKTFLHELLHSSPGLLVGSLGPANLGLAIIVPARRVADAGVDVLESDGEVDEEEVKVVNLPISELATSDGLDFVLVVEGLPELGNDEEVLALHDALLDGAGHALAALLLIAVV